MLNKINFLCYFPLIKRNKKNLLKKIQLPNEMCLSFSVLFSDFASNLSETLNKTEKRIFAMPNGFGYEKSIDSRIRSNTIDT